jgi:hypothetical protein
MKSNSIRQDDKYQTQTLLLEIKLLKETIVSLREELNLTNQKIKIARDQATQQGQNEIQQLKNTSIALRERLDLQQI